MCVGVCVLRACVGVILLSTLTLGHFLAFATATLNAAVVIVPNEISMQDTTTNPNQSGIVTNHHEMSALPLSFSESNSIKMHKDNPLQPYCGASIYLFTPFFDFFLLSRANFLKVSLEITG